MNSANTAADSPDTPERQIVGGKRRSMNRSDIRMREYLCRRLSAARRRQKYEPGFSGQGAAYASGPTLRDRRDDAKCNVAEIGVVNMGEIGAVRKRSR